jgi:hypothetical protein
MQIGNLGERRTSADDHDGTAFQSTVEMVQGFRLGVKPSAQRVGDAADSVEGDGRIFGEPNIFAAGNGEPFVVIIGDGVERLAGDNGIEKA